MLHQVELNPPRESTSWALPRPNESPNNALAHCHYIRAGEGIRTLDINLGKVALYQLSYARDWLKLSSHGTACATLFPGFDFDPLPHPVRRGLMNPHPFPPRFP